MFLKFLHFSTSTQLMKQVLETVSGLVPFFLGGLDVESSLSATGCQATECEL